MTPKDKERTEAFRAWQDAVGGVDEAQRITGIALRTLQRIHSGRQPPARRLLEELAEHISGSDCHTAQQPHIQALKTRLLEAALPAEERHHA